MFKHLNDLIRIQLNFKLRQKPGDYSFLPQFSMVLPDTLVSSNLLVPKEVTFPDVGLSGTAEDSSAIAQV